MELSEVLLRLTRGRDETIFRALYDSYYRQVYNTAYYICRDRDLAKDAVQEAFVRALSSISQLRDAKNFKVWLLTIVSNQAKSLLKAQSRLIPVEDIGELTANCYSAADVVGESLERRETERALLAEVAALPSHYRQLVVLKYYCELKDREIAEALELKPGTVKSRLNRARLVLKRRITENKSLDLV